MYAMLMLIYLLMALGHLIDALSRKTGGAKKHIKRILKDRENLPRTLGVLGKGCVALIWTLTLLVMNSFGMESVSYSIPSDEMLKRVYIRLFKTTFITDSSEYVAFNVINIALAVILCVGFLALLILAGIYMNPREKEPVNSSATKAEDDPA